MTEKQKITLMVNGSTETHWVEPRRLLADYLRHDVGLKGTHIGCEHGVCGACTVRIDGRTARSCLHFAIAVQGSEIETVEGLSEDGRLAELQKAFHAEHGLQCGFCTPGFLLTAEEYLSENPAPTLDGIREALTNNLCRCTGYVNIVKAVARAAALPQVQEDANHDR
ncbi:(2Fe-2S)-binding protein [Limibacillus halophilus]|uniref:Carbon-monoxide dehydrogenase small subunit n=1 Tax=Limibacillus halophilus TaxID=1579333 RepID=A0A839SZ94_9PROT|nr:(2Fe-2S)-binding protein [Limibacillus halophilus]MBB3066990.1 carbon-monoxide dehydrogenase small subunit [Limibacillus halophilus]